MGERSGRGRFRLGAPPLDSGIEGFESAAYARDEATAADCGDDRGGVRSIFENLEAHRRMTGDEIMIVEWVHERPFHAGKRSIPKGLPRGCIRHRDETGAKRPHSLDLRFRR